MRKPACRTSFIALRSFLSEKTGDRRFRDYFRFILEGRPEVYIQRQRLQACIRDLQTGLPGRAITDIALSWPTLSWSFPLDWSTSGGSFAAGFYPTVGS